ncbi:GNAT family N-acetyltransferase [Pseudonocardia sp. CA-107938]|uniref:GNAT family N-acetyltransferase n=1 Tax=Pseudonocardia sp. CA-107938 TaxID=3240021 RepID=UPI003D8B57A8
MLATIPVTVRDLVVDDLPACSWSGSPVHLRYVAAELERVPRGEVDYLALCPPSGLPVGMALLDWTVVPGAGHIGQLAVHPALRSCGLGTLLIGQAEARIVARGRDRADLRVEVGNGRARALYERLGYEAYGEAPDGWDQEGPDGMVVRYETTSTLMRKQLR